MIINTYNADISGKTLRADVINGETSQYIDFYANGKFIERYTLKNIHVDDETFVDYVVKIYFKKISEQ